jgi:hypothetical protein
MHTHSIIHKTGNFQIILVEMESGFSGHIFDSGNKCVTVLHAMDEDAAYDACLKWASANIRGEFQLTTQPTPNFKRNIVASA